MAPPTGSQNWCGRIRAGVTAHKTCVRERGRIYRVRRNNFSKKIRRILAAH
jgi:hypothetical protein